MKKLLTLLTLFVTLSAVSQTQQPSNLPGTSTSAWWKVRAILDSFKMWIPRDTFPAKYATTIWHTDGNFYKSTGNGAPWSLWVSSSPNIDTFSISTRAWRQKGIDSLVTLFPTAGYGLINNFDIDTNLIQNKLSAGIGISITGNIIYNTGITSMPDLQDVTDVDSTTPHDIEVNGNKVGKGPWATSYGSNQYSTVFARRNPAIVTNWLDSASVMTLFGYDNFRKGRYVYHSGAFGYQNYTELKRGYYNWAFGNENMVFLEYGDKNATFGPLVGYNVISSTGSTLAGYAACFSCQYIDSVTAVGAAAAHENVTGKRGAYFAASAGENAVSGDDLLAIGFGSYFASPTESGQMVIKNFIYGRNMPNSKSVRNTAGRLGINEPSPLFTLHTGGSFAIKTDSVPIVTGLTYGLVHDATTGQVKRQLLSTGTVTSFSFTNGGGLTGTVTNATTTPTLSLVAQDAAADGTTKGFAGFNSNYFDASGGIVTIDATNGAASASQAGYVTTGTQTFAGNKTIQGNLTFATDNTYDIGTAGNNRARNVFLAGYINWGGNAFVSVPSNGTWLLRDSDLDGWDRIQFGGSTTAYPALKRNSTEFQAILADNSGLTFIEDLYRRKGSGSPEGVVTAPVGAVYHRTDGGAGTGTYTKESGSGNTGWVAK